ncbi:MAG: tetratricopeptide repeat protein [Myxococcota bacterium]
MTSSRQSFAACLLVLSLVGLAHAEPTQLAGEHFERARVFLQAGRYEDAIKELREAYRLSPHPRVLYNLGQAQTALGRDAEAYDTFSAYAQQAQKNQVQLSESERNSLHETLAALERRTSHIRLSLEPATSSVVVDGQPHDAAVELTLLPGTHELALHANGYDPEILRLHFEPGEHSVVHAKLQPARHTEQPAQPPHAASSRCVSLPMSARASTTSSTQPSHTSKRSRLHWALGLGAAGVISSLSALTLAVYNHNRYENWQNIQADLNQRWRDPSDSGVTGAQATNDAYQRSIHQWDNVTIGLGTAGGLLLLGAAGVYLFGSPRSQVVVGSNRVTWSGQW